MYGFYVTFNAALFYLAFLRYRKSRDIRLTVYMHWIIWLWSWNPVCFITDLTTGNQITIVFRHVLIISVTIHRDIEHEIKICTFRSVVRRLLIPFWLFEREGLTCSSVNHSDTRHPWSWVLMRSCMRKRVNGAWKKDAGGWRYVSQRKHLLAFVSWWAGLGRNSNWRGNGGGVLWVGGNFFYDTISYYCAIFMNQSVFNLQESKRLNDSEME